MAVPVAPLAALASQRVRRALRTLLVALIPVVLVVGSLAGLMVALVLVTTPEESTGSGPCAGVVGGGPVSAAGPPGVASLTAEQLANAQTIVAVGRQAGVTPYGWVIAVATAMQESTLMNLDYGDRDSLGLFQQRAGWGPAEARTDPVRAAGMFYNGSQGNPGLLQIEGYESMPVTRAAQAVQRSAFPDAYAKWEPLAREVVGHPAVLSATCLTSAAYVGDGTAGARAVQAAMQWLGTPYSWGGGGIDGPTEGFAQGAGTVGFDCSSLVQYAWYAAAGVTLPRVTDAQAASVSHLPPGTPMQAGDLLFFRAPGDPPTSYHHMGIYDGQGNMVHAPRTGKTVEVVHDVLNQPYFKSQLALVGRVTAGGAAPAAG